MTFKVRNKLTGEWYSDTTGVFTEKASANSPELTELQVDFINAQFDNVEVLVAPVTEVRVPEEPAQEHTTVCNFNLTHKNQVVMVLGRVGGAISHGCCPACQVEYLKMWRVGQTQTSK